MSHSFHVTASAMLCALVLLSLCACGNTVSAPAETPAPTTEATQPDIVTPTPEVTLQPADSPISTPTVAEEPATPDSLQSSIEAELAELKASALALEDELAGAALTQTEMNQKADELYALWDGELNIIWKSLEEVLGTEAMQRLTDEEMDWVRFRDQQMSDAAAEYTGGSLYAMAYATAGARLTEARVYQLVDYLRYGY